MLYRKIRNIVAALFILFCTGCVSYDTLYRGRLVSSQHLKIRYSKYRGVDRYSMVLKEQGNTLISVYAIRMNGNRNIIFEGIFKDSSGTLTNYHLVTDTAGNVFGSFGHPFFERYNTPATMATFIPVTPVEMAMFHKFSQVLQKKKMNFQPGFNDISRIKGWVKLN